MGISKMKIGYLPVVASLSLSLSAASPAYSADSFLRSPHVFDDISPKDLNFAQEFRRGSGSQVITSPKSQKLIVYGDAMSLSLAQGRGDTKVTRYDYLEGGVTFQSPSYGLSIDLGSVSEDGGLLGQAIGGSLSPTTQSDTNYARVGGRFDLTSDTGIHLGAAIGLSSFNQEGIIVSGENISSTALSLGFSTKRVMTDDDAISVSVSGPLSFFDGRIDQQAIGADGATPPTSSGDASDIGLHMAPVDLQMGYERSLTSGRVSIGGTYSIGGEDPKIGARLGVAFQF